MVALSEQGDQTVGALGEKLFLESNTLTPTLKKLEQTGHISRIRDPADERQVRDRHWPTPTRERSWCAIKLYLPCLHVCFRCSI